MTCRPAMASAACASGWRRPAAGSTPARCRREAGSCGSRWHRKAAGDDPHPAPAGRRPGADPQRARGHARAGGRLRGRRVGRPRRRGGRRGEGPPARRRATRHRDAGTRRPGGGGRTCPGSAVLPVAHPHHLRTARVTCGGRWSPARPGSWSRTPRRNGWQKRSAASLPGSGSSTRRWPRRRWRPEPRRSPPGNATSWSLPDSGATVAEIASKLFLSEGTVRNYLSAAIAKTGTRNRAAAVRTADELGWL